MKMISRLLISLAAVSAISSSNAALYYRGNGMIYDSTQNITWLQDSNYSRTSNYDEDGLLSWSEAKTWAENLVYGGYSDWRLPSSGSHVQIRRCGIDLPSRCGFSDSGGMIASLFYELGNQQFFSQYGVLNYAGVSKDWFIDAATGKRVDFLDFSSSYSFWLDESYGSDPSSFQAWIFDPSYGTNAVANKPWEYRAWAMRTGDVLSFNQVPIPSAAWLMSSGLVGLAGIARRKK